MKTNQSEFTEKIRLHLDNKIRYIHNKFKGQHKFLNNLFFSPGDEHYGHFDRSHTYKTIAILQSSLEIDGFRFVLTDIEFDSDMNLLYLFDIESSEGNPINSAVFNTAKSTLSLTKPKYLID